MSISCLAASSPEDVQQTVDILRAFTHAFFAQAGQRAQAGSEAGQQLEVWGDTDCIAHIPAELQRIYRLLQGDADEVTYDLKLDWRRAFGLHLWCAYSLLSLFGSAVVTSASIYSDYLPRHQCADTVASDLYMGLPRCCVTQSQHRTLFARTLLIYNS